MRDFRRSTVGGGPVFVCRSAGLMPPLPFKHGPRTIKAHPLQYREKQQIALLEVFIKISLPYLDGHKYFEGGAVLASMLFEQFK